MRALLCRIAGAALGLWIADAVLIGITLHDWRALVVAALALAAAHALVRPVLLFFTFPITLLTLGTSLWAINAALLWGTGWLVPGLEVRGIVPALLGAAVISVCAGIAQLWSDAGGDAAHG